MKETKARTSSYVLVVRGAGAVVEEGRQRTKSDSVDKENTGCHRHSCPGLIITTLQGRKPGSQELKP